MARDINIIKQQIVASVQADPILSTKLTSTSKTTTWNTWAFIVAVSINLFEQILDIFKGNVEVLAKQTPAGTGAWIQAKMLEFQYDAIVPQIVRLVNFTPTYEVINAGKTIITRCAVLTTGNKEVLIKVAKGITPTPLVANEISALTSYINSLSFAGIRYTIISQPADLVAIEGNIYYDGQYSITILQSFRDAVNNYFSNLPFNGVLQVASLVDAIQKINGVSNVALKAVRARANSVAYGSLSHVNLMTIDSQSYNPISGYFIEETDAGHDWGTQAMINFIAV